MARGRNKYSWTGAVSMVMGKLGGLDVMLQQYGTKWQMDAKIVADYHTLYLDAQKLYVACKSSSLRTPALLAKRNWAILQAQIYTKDVLRAAIYGNTLIGEADVIAMGFAPRHRPRAEKNPPITAFPDVKAWMSSQLLLAVTVNHHTEPTTPQTTHHGWPEKAPYALIRITDPFGKVITEQLTTRRHNHIPISDELYNHYLLVSATYLAHVDDNPPHAFCSAAVVYVSKSYYDAADLEAIKEHELATKQ